MSRPHHFGEIANPFLTTRLLFCGMDFAYVFLRGAPAHVRECPVKICKLCFLNLSDQMFSDEGWVRINATYGHLSGESVLMKLKDILKAEQLSLSFFVVLDTLEIPARAARLAMRVGIEGGDTDLVWILAS